MNSCLIICPGYSVSIQLKQSLQQVNQMLKIILFPLWNHAPQKKKYVIVISDIYSVLILYHALNVPSDLTFKCSVLLLFYKCKNNTMLTDLTSQDQYDSLTREAQALFFTTYIYNCYHFLVLIMQQALYYIYAVFSFSFNSSNN